MPSATLVVPGRLATRTGGYIYDRQIAEGLRARGWSIDVRELTDDFPFPSPATLELTSAAFQQIATGSIALVDGLAYGAMPGIAVREQARLRLVPIVHLPLADDVGLDSVAALALRTSEQRALAAASNVIVTGASTADALKQYGVASERIVLVEPGTTVAPVATGSQGRGLELLCVATINPGKGHALLIRALGQVRALDWHLTCVGSLTRHPDATRELHGLIADVGLGDRIALTGELDETAVAAHYDRADVFVLPTFKETFGMAVAEAIARAIPVVSTTTGAIPRLVGEGGALVPPGDEQALAGALARVLGDTALRATLTRGALAARARLQTWDTAVERILSVLDQLHG